MMAHKRSARRQWRDQLQFQFDIPCRISPLSVDDGGYARTSSLRFGRRIGRDHIRAWVDANGRLPGPGMVIRHTCDVRNCIEPAHLVEGTLKQNAEDRVRRKRSAPTTGRQRDSAGRFVMDRVPIRVSTGCLISPYRTQATGYAQKQAVRFGKRLSGHHVIAWVDANGALPLPGMVVRHSCDVRNCIEPSHLLLGTPADNTADMIERGRAWFQSEDYVSPTSSPNWRSPQSAKSRCPKGHDLAEAYVKVSKSGQRRRVCRDCALDYAKRTYVPRPKSRYCRNGHELVTDNLVPHSSGRGMRCRTCLETGKRAWYERQKTKAFE